eukprot:TRINITY_DN39887_c0_g1_i1.p1 TRINITY_DN39887_c0_g1~~TRINITY_DN39887_c0_g1_i1.p1  ORF type:complete len:198 (+),score=41.60 TRINITY_DN39887_c0_g1_i1:154-747(+)
MFGGLLGPKLPSMQHALNPAVVKDSYGVGAGAGQPLLDAAARTLAVPAGQPDARLPLMEHQPQQQQAPLLSLQHLREMMASVAREELTAYKPQPVQPMQLIINNHAESNADQHVAAPPPVVPADHARDTEESRDLVEAVTRFFSSRVNRLGLFTVIGLGLYMLQGHLQHRWRMAEYQRRIDANIFLRFSQMIGPPPR